MTAYLAHPDIRVDHDLCPFCGCGMTATVPTPRRRSATITQLPVAVKVKAQRGGGKVKSTYRPCDCVLCQTARDCGTVAPIDVRFPYLGGICTAVRTEMAAELSDAYRARIDAGQRLEQRATGSYWVNADGTDAD